MGAAEPAGRKASQKEKYSANTKVGVHFEIINRVLLISRSLSRNLSKELGLMMEAHNEDLRAFLRTGNLDPHIECPSEQSTESVDFWRPSLRAVLMYMRQRNKDAGLPLCPRDGTFHLLVPAAMCADENDERPILEPKAHPRDVGYLCKQVLQAGVGATLSNINHYANFQGNILHDEELYGKLEAHRHEIRLLSLLPAGWSDPIQCTLYRVSLDENPRYEALSYTWGDPSATCCVQINDKHELQATVSLETALRRLRKPTIPRTIWADAICINQEDVDEKSQQLSIMDRIYGEAQEVLVWLGEDQRTDDTTDNSRAAIRVLEWLASDVHFRQLPFYEGNDPSIANPFDAKGPHLLRAFIRFVNRPWWTRAWVVQETALPHTVTLYVGYVKVS